MGITTKQPPSHGSVDNHNKGGKALCSLFTEMLRNSSRVGALFMGSGSGFIQWMVPLGETVTHSFLSGSGSDSLLLENDFNLYLEKMISFLS